MYKHLVLNSSKKLNPCSLIFFFLLLPETLISPQINIIDKFCSPSLIFSCTVQVLVICWTIVLSHVFNFSYRMVSFLSPSWVVFLLEVSLSVLSGSLNYSPSKAELIALAIPPPDCHTCEVDDHLSFLQWCIRSLTALRLECSYILEDQKHELDHSKPRAPGRQ